jgi:hypothetical protein
MRAAGAPGGAIRPAGFYSPGPLGITRSLAGKRAGEGHAVADPAAQVGIGLDAVRIDVEDSRSRRPASRRWSSLGRWKKLPWTGDGPATTSGVVI